MMSFMEYAASAHIRKADLTRNETELLIKARERLQDTEFGKEILDKTGSLDNPHLWIKMPKDIGGGLRIYIVFGSLSLRLQRDPKATPTGPAFKVVGLKSKADDEELRRKGKQRKTVDLSFNPDLSAVDRLQGEIQRLVQKIRRYHKATRKNIFSSPGQAAQFKGFWPDDPAPSPLY